MQARHEELESLGIKDAAHRDQILAREGVEILVLAAQQNGNPAELIYNLAQKRGFNSRSGRSVQNYSAPPPNREAEARMRRVSEGQRQSRSLGSARGSGPRPLSAQRILDASYAEADKLFNSPEGRALLGEGG